LTLNANGSFNYAPAADFNGTDSFTYRASDGMSQSNIATVTINVSATPEAVPPVTDLTARAKSTEVQLVWTHTGAASYNVYRSTTAGSGFSLITSTDSTFSTYLDRNLINGTRYYYYVIAVAADGTASASSNEVSAVPSARAR
jgi:fibronectin type 3 domain-containing protein